MNNNNIAPRDALDIANGNALKRTGALLLDLVIMYLVMNLFWYAVHPIIDAVYDYSAAVTANTRDLKKSYLVTLDTPLLPDFTNIETVKITENKVPTEKMAEATYHFYLIFLNSEITNPAEKITDDWYIENILLIGTENTIFERIPPVEPSGKKNLNTDSSDAVNYDPFIVDGLKYKDDAKYNSPEAINAFNSKIYAQAVNLFNNRPLMDKINEVNMIENTILLVLSSSVVFLAIPLFLKHGQTLGKKALKLGVATTYGYHVGGLTLLVRFLSFLVINLLSNLFIPIVFPFVSLTVMVFNKHGKSVHDLIARTRVVDLTKTVIFVDEKAYQEHLLTLSARPTADDFNEEVFGERFKEESGA